MNNKLKGVVTVTAGVAIAASFHASTALADSLSSPISASVTADILNVRKNPNTSSSILGTLTRNAKISVLEINNKWYRINYNGAIGWVYSDFISLSSTPAQQQTTVQGTISADVLNFRSGPGTGYSVIGTLSYGQAVNVVSSSGGWSKITCNGKSGYVSSDYVKIISSNTSSNSVSGKKATVTATALNIRSGAGTNYSILGVAKNGSELSLISYSNKWYKVKYNNIEGYVHEDYIKISNSPSTVTTPANTPTATPSTAPSNTIMFEGAVNVDALSLRENNSTSARIISTLYHGQSVKVIAECGSWYKVNFNGTLGYVWKDYISNKTSSSIPPSDSEVPSYESLTGKVAVVTASALNVRSGAGAEYSILGIAKNGLELPIISSANGWYKVQFSSIEGYVCADYVKVADKSEADANEELKSSYPLKYTESIIKHSSAYGIDPNLVAAVIRQESYFNTDAISTSGAMGLMQLMPKTAEWIARMIGFADYSDEKLYDPDTNIMLGTWYLKHLSSQFNNDEQLILAAYNAGPGTVRNWLSDEEYSDDGVTLKNIPFKETANYVVMVPKNKQMYTTLYNLSK